jgi:hypothetical protein
MKLFRRSAVAFVALSLVISSCGKLKDEVAEDDQVPPDIPAAGTLSMSTDSLKESSDDGVDGVSAANHTAAYLTVALTSVVTAAVLAIPNAAVTAALKQEPTLESDGRFKWSYSFTSSATYSANMYGTKNADGKGASFEFYISKTPADANSCCTDFKWMTGSYTNSNAEGSWVIYDHEQPTTATAIRSVDWKFTSEEDKTITITNKVAKDDWKVGGLVKWVVSGSSRVLTVDKDPATEASIIVSWDATTRAGSMVKESGDKVCWDKDLANATCTN